MKMNQSNEHKVFYGIMEIRLAPCVSYAAPFLSGPCDWVYCPQDNMWHSEERSYPAECCRPITSNLKNLS